MFNKPDEHYKKQNLSKTSAIVVIAISVLLVFFSIFLTYPEYPLAEDAFITFRYVENYLNGNGLVFNKSERVEGISNFLWTVLLAVIVQCGFPLLPASAIAGLGFGVLIIWTLWLFSVRCLGRGGYFQFIAPFLLATHTSFVMSCANGLETAFYTFLITGAAMFLVLESGGKGIFPFSSVIMSLASMTRPEAHVVFFAIVLFQILRDAIDCRLRPYTVMSVLVFGCFSAAFIGFRMYYYQDIVPNTVYFKIAAYPFGTGKSILLDFLITTKSYLVFVPALFLCLRTRNNNSLHFIVVTVMIYLTLIFFSVAPIPRYIVPIVPLSFMLVQEGFFQLSQVLERFKSVQKGFRDAAISILATSVLATNLLWHELIFPPFFMAKENPVMMNVKQFFSEPSVIKKKYASRYSWGTPPNNFQALFGTWLREHLSENSVIVYDQMGQTPYYAGLGFTFIDSWGLTDRTISEIQYRANNEILFRLRELLLVLLPGMRAQSSGRSLSFSHYIFSRDPDYLFVLAENRWVRELIASEEFNHRYQQFFPLVPQKIRACYKKKAVDPTREPSYK